ncbi:hypothetical protein C5167_050528 [Papaver somniferum]|uniref:Uncharacterized protein n=1 Tax=Papaver somniferum TaxID=3469 RepID=A0A4Y7LKE6_PAPSO|nr:hypothetical protein C5167_050528 [Papaver somniferum]
MSRQPDSFRFRVLKIDSDYPFYSRHYGYYCYSRHFGYCLDIVTWIGPNCSFLSFAIEKKVI